MNWRRLAGNAMTAFTAQGVALILSVLQTLLIPKVLGVEQYGYWQLFIFYVSYAGFFPLGLIDGVYLLNGGTSRSAIDKKSVVSQFIFGMVFEGVLALTICAIGLLGRFEFERRLVILCAGVYVFAKCIAGFMSNLFQAMDETRRSSWSLIVERVTFLVPLVVLVFIRSDSFLPFVISYIGSCLVQIAFELHFFTDFIKSGFTGWRRAARDSFTSMRVGVMLMLANVASQLVLGVGRFSIDSVWGISTFGKLSLALSLTSFFLTFVNQASMVLFPALRKAGDGEVTSFYRNISNLMSLFFPFVYILYYPLVWLLGLWLPEYSASFIYFAYLIPICVFDSKMNIACVTYFKVARKERKLLWINILTAVISATGSFVGAVLFSSIEFVIASMVLAIALRSIIAERVVDAELRLRNQGKMMVGEAMLAVAFIILTSQMDGLGAAACFVALYSGYLFVHRGRCMGLIDKIRGLRSAF